MTDKELKEDMIVKMLDFRSSNVISIRELYPDTVNTYPLFQQKKIIFKYLNDNGYIDTKYTIDGTDYFSITSKGVKYAEELLAKRSKETGKPVNENKIKIDDVSVEPIPPIASTQEITLPSYTTIENNKKIIDNNVPACFNVEGLAECYVKLIDRACENEQHNVCLFGIFAPWGRGKSYFFKKVKEYINSRHNSEAIQYDIIEFNAWKYQETPAIWAYLFETLYKSKSWWFKFRYTFRRNWKSIFSETLLCLSPTLITVLGTLLQKCITNIDNILIGTSVASLISIIGLIYNFISKHYNSAISLIKRYSKGISFANELGVQAEIEKEITSLLKFWISDEEAIEKKVILYVDDIDRCSETKMTSIIDSLRTVLENEEIRKRLIIICSIDPEKIIKGLEYKYINLYNKDEIHSIAIDQMDKIFLTGIALSPLDNDQLLEFASKLAEVNDNSIYNQQFVTADGEGFIASDGQPFMVSRPTSSPDRRNIKLNDTQIYKQLKNLINNYDNEKKLTPRKIRIIYYRILLANNIICNKENPMITETLIKNIFNLSVGMKADSDNSEELSDVLDMVVPYRYNEENKYENKVKDKMQYSTVDVAIKS